MSAKSELVKVLTNYRNAYEQVRAQIDQIRKNPDYTEEGKVNLIDPIVTNFVPSVDQARQAAAAVIQGALEALDSFGVVAGMTGGAHLRDAGYQTGLANVLHMLEIGALDADEVRRIAKEYEGDYAAIATMRKLCAGRGWAAAGIMDIFPKDTREHRRQVLVRLLYNVEQYINIAPLKSSGAVKAWNGAPADIPVLIDGLVEFINHKLGDDLSMDE
mgnify:CR=1 FL=1